MEDLGGLLFYIALAVIALVGSLRGRGKKTGPKKTVTPERTTQYKPVVRQAQPVRPAEIPRRSQYSAPPVDEGKYEEPMAAAFADEGSIADSIAAAFAMEGASSMHEIQFKDFVHTEISDSEIGDAPAYDYNAAAHDEIVADGFSLRKAVIYSAILDRKEYSF